MIHLIITLVLVGVVLYVVEALLPIEPWIKRIIHVVVVLCVLLYLLRTFAAL